MSLLSLPPELLLKIFAHALPSPVDPLLVVPLTLIHSSLTPIAHQFQFVDLILHSDRQAKLLVNTSAFLRHAASTRSLKFDAGRGKGIGTGGIGSEETIEGKWLEQILNAIESAYSRDKGESRSEPRLRELDVKDCKGFRSSVLQGESLKNLKKLRMGTGVIFDSPRQFEDDFNQPNTDLQPTWDCFLFNLESLTLENNHWESLSDEFLSCLFFSSCANSLEVLDLSSLYSIGSLSGLLKYPPHNFASIKEVSLPPAETFSQILFSCLLVDLTRSLTYLELPNLSDPASSILLLPFFRSIERNSHKILEIGFKNFPSQALIDSILIVLQGLFGGPPGSTEAESSKAGLKRLRMLKIRNTAEVSRLIERDGELVVDLIGQFGCEVAYGKYERAAV
ncbi:uncharacterized protein JCM6883_000405 [Sporobolomyces salmoneus]|uniref:uncharacterized protein n=1 Tax=Sporobolomyces salmoneus TaxID=183962 RepID=UPI0031805185